MSSRSPARSGTQTTPRSCSLPDRSTLARPGTVTSVRLPFYCISLIRSRRWKRESDPSSVRSPFRRRVLDELCRHLARAPDCDAGRPKYDELFVALSPPSAFAPLSDFADRILSPLAKNRCLGRDWWRPPHFLVLVLCRGSQNVRRNFPHLSDAMLPCSPD